MGCGDVLVGEIAAQRREVQGSLDRRMLEEVAKCDILCSNCHRNRTLVRRRQYDAGVAQSGLERLPSK